MRNFWKTLWLDLQAIIWPTACVGCGHADRDLCDACLESALKPPRESGRGSWGMREHGSRDLEWYAAGSYEGVLRGLIIRLKHGGRYGDAKVLGRVIAPLLAAMVRTKGVDIAIIPIPSRLKKRRERGFDHLGLVIEEALRVLGMPASMLAPKVLKTTSGRTGQVGLGESERLVNAGRIRVVTRRLDRLSGRPVIVFDDVVTTGATMTKAVDALQGAGANVVGVFAVCEAIKKKRNVGIV